MSFSFFKYNNLRPTASLRVEKQDLLAVDAKVQVVSVKLKLMCLLIEAGVILFVHVRQLIHLATPLHSAFTQPCMYMLQWPAQITKSSLASNGGDLLVALSSLKTPAGSFEFCSLGFEKFHVVFISI